MLLNRHFLDYFLFLFCCRSTRTLGVTRNNKAKQNQVVCQRTTHQPPGEKLEILAYLLQRHERHWNAYTLYNKRRRGNLHGDKHRTSDRERNRDENKE